jgi:hypothetical protein
VQGGKMVEKRVDKELCDRVKKIKEKLRFRTTQEMADYFKVSKSSIDQAFIYRKNPPRKLIDGLVKKAEVNYEWLISGEGEMFDKSAEEDSNINVLYGKDVKKLIESNHQLTVTNSKVVEELLRILKEEEKK